MKSRKKLSGDGWSFEPARPAPAVPKPSVPKEPAVSLEKRAKGKVVTVVKGLPLDADALALAAKTLKASCGAGGSVRDGVIELQGDHQAKVREWICKLS